jgi:hypothetical protein
MIHYLFNVYPIILGTSIGWYLGLYVAARTLRNSAKAPTVIVQLHGPMTSEKAALIRRAMKGELLDTDGGTE